MKSTPVGHRRRESNLK